ncbi:flagellar biosynthesis protein FlhA [Desulfosarcina alkanivorans]|uniref:Flagellar biosynthesis protein FlhA n=1 Tax=Desulfosarcina alkanivorans TaxID=571177 RepID=A0A5K7YKE8_9BACT|nr:flagellar biosynthesis protein FlhA [Desulfosarcina alkanivorans]BBO66774.1 flagellar biosynthesis protein FlhA [Desulfosarcina alkanivorans]
MEMAERKQYLDRFAFVTNNTDVLMGFAAMSILMVMVIPIPAMMLDLFLSFNITLALIILLVGMYILKPLDLSSFPSLLLLSTLFRLSLNVASTRMILLHGNEGTHAAGKVIMAFGNFVVGGNYIVGFIVFIILVVINFMVITKGAGRIAEVAARFTLDAMPGKQMSIDADLNAGLIDETQARQRRRQISREAEYYGAMDGANKFVRGDAVAGIIITFVNILAGLAIGVFQKNMNFADAAQTYTLLTVGDGLVSQIPALIISTAAGIVVTRAGAEKSLGLEIGSQLLVQPRAFVVAAVMLFGFGLVPGLPTIPFLILSATSGLVAYLIFQIERAKLEADRDLALQQEQKAEEKPTESFKPLPPIDVLALEVGYGLIPLVDVDQDGELLERIKSIRRQIAQEVGIVVPSIHIQDNMKLKPGAYSILLKGIEVASGDLMINHLMAMNPGAADASINGVATREPTYGLEAFWIKPSAREDASAKGYTVVDLATILTTHLSDVIRRHAHELVGRQEVQKMLDTLKASHPKVVEELVPNLISLGGVVRVTQNLLLEQVPVRDLLTIMETLADWAPTTKKLDILTEHVRQALARTITSFYQAPDGNLHVLTLDQRAEKKIAESLQQTDQGTFLAIDPAYAKSIMDDLSVKMEDYKSLGVQPLLVCSAQIRSHFKKLADRFIPGLSVLSYDEIVSSAKIQIVGTVEASDAD